VLKGFLICENATTVPIKKAVSLACVQHLGRAELEGSDISVSKINLVLITVLYVTNSFKFLLYFYFEILFSFSFTF